MSTHSAPRRILYLQYTNPGAYPPLLHSSKILAEAGWRVLFVGTGALGSSALTMPQHANIQCVQSRFHARGWKQKLHYLWFSIWSVYWTIRSRPDWIYASDLWACFPSLLIHWLLRVPLVYHEHDAPAPYDQGYPSTFLRFTYWSRRKCACVAAFCIIPNESRAKTFQLQTGASRVKVVWNCPDREEVAPPKDKPGSVLTFLYHGSIVPERLPLNVIYALKEVRQPVLLKIVGYETTGSVGYLAQIKRIAAELGISDRLEILKAMPRRELMQICATCDVGFALLPSQNGDTNLINMTGASNKPFDYMACGLAVVVTSVPAWRDFLVRPGYGLDCEPTDAASIAAVMQFLCDHPEEVRAMGERGRQRILSEWNYQAQFHEVLRLLSQTSECRVAASSERSVY